MISIFSGNDGSGAALGFVKADGTVDFIAAERWDSGHPDTTIVSETGMTVSDGVSATTSYGAGQMVMSNGVDSVVIQPGVVSVTGIGQTSFLEGDGAHVPKITDIGTGIDIEDTSGSGIAITTGGVIVITAGVAGVDFSANSGDLFFPTGSQIRAGGRIKAGTEIVSTTRIQAGTTIETADPGTGVGLWKLGKKITPGGVLVLNVADYIEVMIDGVVKKLALIV